MSKDTTDSQSQAEAPAEPELPAGKAKVVIAADFTNPSRVGKTVTLPEEEADVLVREGRARYVRHRTSAGVVAAGESAPLPVTTVVQPSSSR